MILVLSWALNPMTDIFIRERKGIFLRHEEEGHTKIEAEIGVRPPQTKEC